MTNSTIYSSLLETKDGSIIPVLKNGKTLESRYSPKNEALKKIEQIQKDTNFFIVIGLCSGILIQELLKINKNAKVLVIEETEVDYNFLKQLSLVKELFSNEQIIFCNINNLYKNLIENYIPSFYGSLEILENTIWTIENKISYSKIKQIIQIALDDIALDFSVQSHFGKLWQKNIINNLKILQQNKSSFIEPNINKTAMIVAAGPSLDKNIDLLKQNKNLYIIATDTAFSTLVKNNIKCDCVISIDGQNISHNHFYLQKDKSFYKNTLFIFDLTANSSCVKYLIKNKLNVFFSINNHPFSNYINNSFNNCFINLFTGSGTVTIAAVDFAIQNGFKDIQVLGADFSYINSKPYCKGTYLDVLYTKNSNKVFNTEKQFVSLMYRTQIQKINQNQITTNILQKYQESFLQYLKQKNISFNIKNNIYYLENKNPKLINLKESINVDMSIIKETFLKNHDSFALKNNIFLLNSTDICLLPLISWLRNIDNIKRKSFSELLDKAYKYVLRIL